MAIANGTCISFCNQSKAHFVLPWYDPGTIAVNVTWMKKRIQCLSNALQHVPIYLQPFTSYSEILGRKLQLFPILLAFNAHVGGILFGIPGKSLDLSKLESCGYQAVKTG